MGYVDYGGVCSLENKEGREAREVFVVMVVGINVSWKSPIAYFFTDGLRKNDKANIVTLSISLLHDAGVEVVSLTFDGLCSNIAMAEELGASMKPDNMKPYFKNPVTGNNVYIMLDACHMLKLTRNLFGDYKELTDINGNKILWQHIVQLCELQINEGLRLANKLRMHHIHYMQQKMKVSLSAHVLSSSVGIALQYLREDLQIPQFSDTKGTEDFCLLFDHLFDMLNSKNYLASGYKAALSAKHKDTWEQFLMSAKTYLLGLKFNGKAVYKTPRSTAIVGFLSLIESMRGLYAYLIDSDKLKYLCLYKCSQDHIEMFFSQVRGRLGWNNNPSAVQFIAAYKQLLVRNEVKYKRSANCVPQDNTALLPWTCVRGKVIDPINFSNERRYDYDSSDHMIEHDYVPVPGCNMTEYTKDVVVYIAGFVSRRVRDKVKCDICVSALFTDNVEHIVNSGRFINRKNNGGLVFPSRSVVKLCMETERAVRQHITIHEKPPSGKCGLLLQQAVLTQVSNTELFDDIHTHMFENVFPENHLILLMKYVIKYYINIRCHHVASEFTNSLHKKLVRQKLTKSILFMHQ